MPPAQSAPTPPIPAYLEQAYWWAYVHPRAVHFFEREWLVNLILWGHYSRLRDLALQALGTPVSGSTLQIACVYGNLTARLVQRLASDARLSVVDILPIQLDNLARKIPPDARVTLRHGDACALPFADSTHDQTLLFFLLHEQPEAVRRATLREALRVTRPGGRVVIVDYHRPHALHPLKPLMRQVFRWLEPFAMDLWQHPLEDLLPADLPLARLQRQTLFGGLYQLLVLER
jgi:ubiquinone/menaquinone biosynthesis C-methylase UbiE